MNSPWKLAGTYGYFDFNFSSSEPPSKLCGLTCLVASTPTRVASICCQLRAPHCGWQKKPTILVPRSCHWWLRRYNKRRATWNSGLLAIRFGSQSPTSIHPATLGRQKCPAATLRCATAGGVNTASLTGALPTSVLRSSLPPPRTSRLDESYRTRPVVSTLTQSATTERPYQRQTERSDVFSHRVESQSLSMSFTRRYY